MGIMEITLVTNNDRILTTRETFTGIMEITFVTNTNIDRILISGKMFMGIMKSNSDGILTSRGTVPGITEITQVTNSDGILTKIEWIGAVRRAPRRQHTLLLAVVQGLTPTSLLNRGLLWRTLYRLIQNGSCKNCGLQSHAVVSISETKRKGGAGTIMSVVFRIFKALLNHGSTSTIPETIG